MEAAERKTDQKKKSFTWLYLSLIPISIVLSVLIWSFPNIVGIHSFSIPTPAMKGTILVGDRIRGGYDTTPIKNGDVVVFKVPRIEENNYGVFDKSQWVDNPISQKIDYIKRCVAISGDVLEIKNKNLFINARAVTPSETQLFRYIVVAKDEIRDKNLINLGLDQDDYQSLGRFDTHNPNYVYYFMYLSSAKWSEVKALPYVVSAKIDSTSYEPTVFPFSSYSSSWTGSNYGPLTIPKEGMKILINDSTVSLYGFTIQAYENQKNVKIDNGKLTIDGKEVTEFSFLLLAASKGHS